MKNITEFLRHVYFQEQLKLHRAPGTPEQRQHELDKVTALMKIVEWHKNWPILLQKPAKIEPDIRDIDYSMNQITMRMTQEMEWVTQQQYVERFGSEPPTSPILRIMAQPYSEHPDFNPDWKLPDA